MTNKVGTFQGHICGDAGNYEVRQDENGVTYGFLWTNKTTEPDYVGTETGLRQLAKAKNYTRWGF